MKRIELLRLIAYVRDLGTESQAILEEKIHCQIGIDLKRDGAKFLIDFFLDPSNRSISQLQKSLRHYFEFAVFFQHARLQYLRGQFCLFLKPHRKYQEDISESFAEFPHILKLVDQEVPELLFNLKGIKVGSIDFQDEAAITSTFEKLKGSKEIINKLEMQYNNIIENEEKIKKGLYLQIGRRIKSFLNPLLWSVGTKVIAGLIVAFIATKFIRDSI